MRRWPAPVVDAIAEQVAEHKSTEHGSAWGHHKIWTMLRRDGVSVSKSSVKRSMQRQGLLLPARYQTERRKLAQARKALFVAPPTRRNRVWQTDFSEFETTGGGDWQLSGVVDYVAKVCLACPANPTQTARDAIAALEQAFAEVEALLGITIEEDCIDPATGEIHVLTIVSDNGPAYKADAFTRFVEARPWLAHVRTRYRSPQSNGVIERFYETVKYEHLYRQDIANGIVLNDELAKFRHVYNELRPHEHLGILTPGEAYRADPSLTLAAVEAMLYP